MIPSDVHEIRIIQKDIKKNEPINISHILSLGLTKHKMCPLNFEEQ